MKSKSDSPLPLREFHRQIKQDRWVLLTMIMVSALMALSVYFRWIYVVGKGDYPHHILVTDLILAKPYQEIPSSVIAHPAYQLLMLGIYFLFFQKASFFGIAVVIQVVAQIFIVWIIYQWLGGIEKRDWNWNWIRAALAVTLTMVTPIMAFVMWDRFFYLGYIGLATYHNPTIQLLKPVALASFICAVRTFAPGRSSWTFILLSASLTILSALIKPNYPLCILPALGLVAAVFMVKKRPFDWRLSCFGFFVPGGSILAAQFVVAYYLPNNENSSILFSPFAVASAYSHYLVPKFFLSILFPLTVLAFNFRRIRRDNTLLLAWAGFFVSVLQMYFLAEGGSRFMDGNFFWGAQIMSLILFVASARFVWREKLATGTFPIHEKAIVLLIYAAHVVAGIAYFVSLMTLPRYA